MLLLSWGAFHVWVSPQELEARKKDLRWYDRYCTVAYIQEHPWTKDELDAAQMDFRTRRIEFEKETNNG